MNTRRPLPACGNVDCGVSTGIHEGLTFGYGRITFCGFWEFPCAPCARAYELKNPKERECWPFVGQDVAELTKDIQLSLAEEQRAWAGL